MVPARVALRTAGRLIGITAACLLFLLLTGVIDERWLVAYLALDAGQIAAHGNRIRAIWEAFRAGDWERLAQLSASAAVPLLRLYALWSLLVLAVTVAAVIGLLPPLRRAVAALRADEPALATPGAEPGDAQTRMAIAAGLRRRAARKRIEAFFGLAAALGVLLVAVGFVSREVDTPWNDTLQTGLGEIRDTVGQARSASDRLSTELSIALAGETFDPLPPVPAAPGDPSADESAWRDARARAAAARSDTISAMTLLAQDTQHHLGFATAQMGSFERLASQELQLRMLAVVAAKAGAVALMFLLVRIMHRVYRDNMAMSISYDAIADTLQSGPRALGAHLLETRRALSPAVEREAREDAGLPDVGIDVLLREAAQRIFGGKPPAG